MIYLMRHGAITNSGGRFVGQRNLPLSDIGIAQAASWSSFFSKITLDACIASDLTRCLQTAKQVLSHRNISILQEPRLREISLGMWEGLTKEDVQERFPEEYTNRGADLIHTRPSGGESFFDLAQRVMPVLTDIVSKYEDKNVLVVAHSGVNKTFLSWMMALPFKDLMDIPQPYACCTRITSNDITGNFSEWLCPSGSPPGR